MHSCELLYARLLPLSPITYENINSHKLSRFWRYKGIASSPLPAMGQPPNAAR